MHFSPKQPELRSSIHMFPLHLSQKGYSLDKARNHSKMRILDL